MFGPRFTSVACFTLLALSSGVAAIADEPIGITDNSRVRFASRDEGVRILTADDEFARQLTKFDLQVRLQTTGEATLAAWRESVAEQVLAWEAEDQLKVTGVLEKLRDKLAKLRLPLPHEVLLIRTTGKDEANAAYTRANAIVLPRNVLLRQSAELESLLLHELFHVFSRHNRDVRRELYRSIGFEIVPDIELPPSLRDRKMTNPDAPAVDCIIKLQVNDETVTAAPLLYATPAQFDPKHGTSLFQYLTFRLLVVEPRDGQLSAAMKGEQPVVLDPKGLDSFYSQIGRNTQYIIHPDEILADNFVCLVQQRENLKTPRVVQQMARILAK